MGAMYPDLLGLEGGRWYSVGVYARCVGVCKALEPELEALATFGAGAF